MIPLFAYIYITRSIASIRLSTFLRLLQQIRKECVAASPLRPGQLGWPGWSRHYLNPLPMYHVTHFSKEGKCVGIWTLLVATGQPHTWEIIDCPNCTLIFATIDQLITTVWIIRPNNWLMVRVRVHAREWEWDNQCRNVAKSKRSNSQQILHVHSSTFSY